MLLKPLDDYIAALKRSDTSGRVVRDKKRQVLLRTAALTRILVADELEEVRRKLVEINRGKSDEARNTGNLL